MQYLETLAVTLALGVILLAYSRYLRRTRNVRSVLMFWTCTLAMSPDEFRLQRAGILLLMGGVVLRYLTFLDLS